MPFHQCPKEANTRYFVLNCGLQTELENKQKDYFQVNLKRLYNTQAFRSSQSPKKIHYTMPKYLNY